jgi:hypothetical protein
VVAGLASLFALAPSPRPGNKAARTGPFTIAAVASDEHLALRAVEELLQEHGLVLN